MAEMYCTSDLMADVVETCEYCDRLVNSPNFAYHVCTGRKWYKGTKAAQPLRAVDAAMPPSAEQNPRSNIVPAVEFDTQPRP